MSNQYQTITKEIELFAIDLYISGYTLVQTGKILGIDRSTVSKILKRHKVSSRWPYSRPKKYQANENFFDTINTEEKAYWLGALTADGHISKRRQVSLYCHSNDREWLTQFNNSLESTYPIFDRNNGNMSQVTVCSHSMADRLKALGLLHNKSYTATFCEEVPQLLIGHYFRGLVDGDGCIYITKENQFSVSLVGTYSIVGSFSRFCSDLGIRYKEPIKRNDCKSLFVVDYTGNREARVVLDALYSKATACLVRKFNLAHQLINSNLGKTFYSEFTNLNDLELLYKRMGTWKQVASHISVSYGHFKRIKSNLLKGDKR